jgi:hypothetical protein
MRKKGKREWNEKKQRIEADRFVALSLRLDALAKVGGLVRGRA